MPVGGTVKNCIQNCGGTSKEAIEVPVEVNGQLLQSLLDTGSTITLVKTQYVTLAAIDYTLHNNIQCGHDDVKSYPTADIHLGINDQVFGCGWELSMICLKMLSLEEICLCWII